MYSLGNFLSTKSNPAIANNQDSTVNQVWPSSALACSYIVLFQDDLTSTVGTIEIKVINTTFIVCAKQIILEMELEYVLILTIKFI